MTKITMDLFKSSSGLRPAELLELLCYSIDSVNIGCSEVRSPRLSVRLVEEGRKLSIYVEADAFLYRP